MVDPITFLAVADPITLTAVLSFVFLNIAVPMALAIAITELSKKSVKPPSVTPSTLNMPLTDEGVQYTIIFGTCWIENPVIPWWGDVSATPIVRHYSVNKWFNNKRVYYTIGYHYAMGTQEILTQGQSDGIKQIKAGGTLTWPNSADKTVLQADGATSAIINLPNLFGGDEAEGGIVGTLNFQYGAITQEANDYLIDQLSSITAQDLAPVCLAFSNDGATLLVLGKATDFVYEYQLGTAWGISTAAYTSTSFFVGTQESLPMGLTFSTDGTKMYIVGRANRTIYQYSLGTAWDISTASYASKSFYITEDTAIFSFKFSADGSKLYVLGSYNDRVYQYTLSTPWNISTASYASKNFYVASQESAPSSIVFSSDGGWLYVVGIANKTIYQYSLGTAWDISTASYASKNKNISSQTTRPFGLTFSSDGLKSYVINVDIDRLFQFDLTSAWDISTASYSSEWGQIGSHSISASRGLTSIVKRQVRFGTSPYPKNWAYLVKRTAILTDGTAQWYLAKATINTLDINPAHILRECYTNTEWGFSYSTGLFNETIWRAFADTLYTEGFGLSLKWEDQNQTLENFVLDVLRHINGIIYQDPSTGEFVPKLIRDDYIVGNLEEFNDSDMESVEDFTRGAYHRNPNAVRLTYWNRLDNTEIAITDHDIALINAQNNKLFSYDTSFLGVMNDTLAGKLVARERQQLTSFFATMKIKAKRTMSHLRPGDVFKLTWPVLGISQMVVRVIKPNYGTLTDGYVTFECVEDVFSVQTALYSTPPASGWTNPLHDPAVVPAHILQETPFWDIYLDTGLSDTLALDDDSGFLQVAASQPSRDALDYELMLRDSPTGDFYSDGRGAFTPTGILDSFLPLNAVDATITLTDVEGLYDVEAGTYAVIEDEIVKVKSTNPSVNQVTIARGCLDTVPTEHDSLLTEVRVWFVGSVSYIAGREYTTTNQPGVKILPRTPKGQLDEGDATAYNATAFSSRMNRPYPPGAFKVDGVSYPSTFTGQPTISWTHRDRTQQLEEITEHSAVSIGPEAGTTYTLQIYDEDNVLVRTETGLTGTSYTYDWDDELADCGIASGGALNTSLRFVLKSRRNGYDSWKSYDLRVNRV